MKTRRTYTRDDLDLSVPLDRRRFPRRCVDHTLPARIEAHRAEVARLLNDIASTRPQQAPR